MKIIANILGIRLTIDYLCWVYLICGNKGFHYGAIYSTRILDTRLSPSIKIGGGFFYKLYSGCISLHLSKALQNNTASISSTRMISKLGTVCPLDNRVSSYAYKLGYFKNLYTFIADI